MTTNLPNNDYGVRYKQLAERLATCPQVSRYDTEDNPEAWTLSHSFLDLAESFQRFLTEQLPQLERQTSTPEKLYEALLEIGEEFRHVMYHLKQPRFYRRFLDLEE